VARSRAWKTFALTFVVVATLLPAVHAGATESKPTGDIPLRVMYMGDSLAWESRQYFEALLTDSDRVVVDESLTYGGTAICDWFSAVRRKVRHFRPDVAVVEFAGNALTPCMQELATGEPYEGAGLERKYARDANTLMRAFDRYGVTVYWAQPPAQCPGNVLPLAGVWPRVLHRWDNARLIDAATLFDVNGACRDVLPCVAEEPCTATDPMTGAPAAVVRAPDGVHFCPNGPEAVAGVTESCSTWASGAWRFAAALATPIVRAYLSDDGVAPTLPTPAQVVPQFLPSP
jgi:hypothetical protein